MKHLGCGSIPNKQTFLELSDLDCRQPSLCQLVSRATVFVQVEILGESMFAVSFAEF